MNLLEKARYGEVRGVELLADHPEVRLVLFSLQQGQEVRGQGEPRVHLVCLEGEGILWAGERSLPATPGTLMAAEPGEAHGAKAGEGTFLVLGIITPQAMIPASRLALTAALLWFLAASLVGLLLGLGLLPYTWRPAHAHMQLLGFVSLMIYGVAYHALPRFRGVVFRRPGLALFQVLLANLGLLGMVLAWGLGLGIHVWGFFAFLSLVAGSLFVLLMLEVLWG